MAAAAARKFQARDLTLIHADTEPRVSSIRVAERLGVRTAVVNQWVERNTTQLERYGNISRDVIYSGQRGRPADECFLNENQVTLVIMRSDSKEADDARFEIIMLLAAFRRGEIPQSEITIITDLFDPKPATITRGPDNVVHVTPAIAAPIAPDPEDDDDPQKDLDELTERERKELEAASRKAEQQLKRIGSDGIQGRLELPHPNAHNAFKRETWVEEFDDVSYVVIKERNAQGDVASFTYLRDPPVTCSTDTALIMPWINGRQVNLRLNHIIPLTVLERTYLNQLPDGVVKTTARNTLSYFLAL